MLTIYLAAPFFNDEQRAIVSNLEQAIEEVPFRLLSPRRTGLILNDMTPEQRQASAREIFLKNVEWIEASDALLAVIDGRDPGTIWEMGYACAKKKIIYSYTDKSYGINVMLQGSVKAHAKGVTQLREMLNDINWNRDLSRFSPNFSNTF